MRGVLHVFLDRVRDAPLDGKQRGLMQFLRHERLVLDEEQRRGVSRRHLEGYLDVLAAE